MNMRESVASAFVKYREQNEDLEAFSRRATIAPAHELCVWIKEEQMFSECSEDCKRGYRSER